jgi:hypothetical protein
MVQVVGERASSWSAMARKKENSVAELLVAAEQWELQRADEWLVARPAIGRRGLISQSTAKADDTARMAGGSPITSV